MVSNLNRHSSIPNEQWIFWENFSAFGQIENPLNGLNVLEDIYIKFMETELVEIS